MRAPGGSGVGVGVGLGVGVGGRNARAIGCPGLPAAWAAVIGCRALILRPEVCRVVDSVQAGLIAGDVNLAGYPCREHPPPPLGVGVGVGVGVDTGVGVGVGDPLTGCHKAGTLGGSHPTCEVWAWRHLYSTFWYITSAPTAYAVFGAQLGIVSAAAGVGSRRHTNAAIRLVQIREFLFIALTSLGRGPAACLDKAWPWRDAPSEI